MSLQSPPQGPVPRRDKNEHVLAILCLSNSLQHRVPQLQGNAEQTSSGFLSSLCLCQGGWHTSTVCTTVSQRLREPNPRLSWSQGIPGHHCHAATTSPLLSHQQRVGICKTKCYKTGFLCHTQQLFSQTPTVRTLLEHNTQSQLDVLQQKSVQEQ